MNLSMLMGLFVVVFIILAWKVSARRDLISYAIRGGILLNLFVYLASLIVPTFENPPTVWGYSSIVVYGAIGAFTGALIWAIKSVFGLYR